MLKKITKLAIAVVGVAAAVSHSTEALALGADGEWTTADMDTYSCSDTNYGVNGTYWGGSGGSYGDSTSFRSQYTSSCVSGHTSNTPGAVVTASATMRAATANVTGMITQRIAAVRKAQKGQGGMAVTAALDEGEGLNGGQLGLAGGDKNRGIGVWVQGRFTSVDNDDTATKFDGNIWDVMVGVDKQIGGKAVVGISGGYESSDIDTKYNNGKIDGDGYLIAPYLSVAFNQMFSLDVNAGYAWLEYDMRRLDSVTGDTHSANNVDATRWWISGQLNAEKTYKKADLGAFLGLNYSREKRDGFTETTNGISTMAATAATSAKLGQVRLGATAAMNTDGKVQPYGRLAAEYDFTQDDLRAGSNQAAPSNDKFGMVAALGLNLNLAPNVSGTIEANGNFFRDDYSAYGGLARLRVEF